MTSELSPVIISNIEIRQDQDGRHCLNDLHKASGGLPQHAPNFWLKNQQTKDLVDELRKLLIYSDTQNPVSDKINHLEPIKIVKSFFMDQGTFVVEELVYAYAMWISPAFHLQVIRSYAALAKAPQPGSSANLEARMDRMEGYMEKIAVGMCTMVNATVQQADKADMTDRYIELLELNQKGMAKINRTVEAECKALAAQGVNMTEIARQVRVSRASVSLLVRDKYPWSYAQAALPPASVQPIADSMKEAERAMLLERLAKLDGAQ